MRVIVRDRPPGLNGLEVVLAALDAAPLAMAGILAIAFLCPSLLRTLPLQAGGSWRAGALSCFASTFAGAFVLLLALAARRPPALMLTEGRRRRCMLSGAAAGLMLGPTLVVVLLR